VLTTGKRSRRSHFDIYWIANEAGLARLGLVVSKPRQTAVTRNRLRRRLREIWRREIRSRLGGLDVVIRTRAEAYGATFQQLQAELAGWVAALEA
ncbi:MAG: ribonuclease P protein component, partial [Gemmatimonadales bacterium]